MTMYSSIMSDHDKLMDKLYNWWVKLAQGNFIIIYRDGTSTLISSAKKTNNAKSKEILEKWKEYNNDKTVKAIIWSAQSTDAIESFIDMLIKKSTKNKLEKLIGMKKLPEYLIENYKTYFEKLMLIGEKDYTV
jgi:hypothetical protein